MPPFTLSAPTASDGPALARNNMEAFYTDPAWALLWPPSVPREQVISAGAARLPWALVRDRPGERHLKAVDGATGAAVGYARWKLPAGLAARADAAPWREALVPDVGAAEREGLARAFADAWWAPADLGGLDQPVVERKEEIEALVPGKEYLVLDYLAVHPDHRRQGIATLLVEAGVRAAETLGVDVSLIATPAGLGVYKRLGFKLCAEFLQDYSRWGGPVDYVMRILIRDGIDKERPVPEGVFIANDVTL